MMKRFSQLVSVMERLRGREGCPWDREQTRESLKPFLLEETYEVLEAIDEKNPELLKEELGDLLFQILFHSQIARERNEFEIEDVLIHIINKMTRRHPHVFGPKGGKAGSGKSPPEKGGINPTSSPSRIIVSSVVISSFTATMTRFSLTQAITPGMCGSSRSQNSLRGMGRSIATVSSGRPA